MRFYEFTADEILEPTQPFFDTEFDPKIDWAFRHIQLFPIEVNRATYHELLRVPGIGPTSAKRIITQRRVAHVPYEGLAKMGVVMKRARYFLTCGGHFCGDISMYPENIKRRLRLQQAAGGEQLTLWEDTP